ncbi:MAG TPA: HAMP domain-containing sensor histidine kinase [Mucilaginibacter sp.]|nr:HAMP domain-containing sensor histidine kinase [Mucilaginibacter sp.]
MLLFYFLISACQRKQAKEKAGYSQAFVPVLDKVSTLFGTDKEERGLHYLDSAMNRISDPYVDDKFRAFGFHYVYWEKTKGDNQKALLYADSMLTLANKSVSQKDYESNYVEANMALGDAYFAMQKYNDAYLHYFQGFRIGKNYLNNGALSDYSYRMGMILYKMGHYKLAANYFKESYRMSSPTRDKFADFYRNQEVLDNIALSYKHYGDLDSAMFYFGRALQYINQNRPQYAGRQKMMEMASGVVYGNEAEVLILKGDTKGATDLLKKSIAINLQKGNDNRDAELAEIKLAQIYYDESENEQLKNLLSVLRTQLDSVKNEDAEADWNRLMSGYYLTKNDFKTSRDYLQTYLTLRDSGIKKLNLLKESDVNQQLDSFEKQYLIDNLKGNNKIQQQYLYAAIACVVMAMVIVLLVFRNWRRSKRDVKTVNALNQQVSLQKIDLENTLEELKTSILEKDRILRTVAHDLRNPIGGIASLTLAMEDDDFTPEQKELISIIRETSNDTLELISEILEVTNGGESLLKKELVDINTLVGKNVELLRFKAAEKNQHIELQLLQKPDEILISREKIGRVLSNLISNAIKFSPRGTNINVSILDLKKEVEIAVRDNGIGVPEKMQHEIFNIFTDAKRPGTAGEKSFGLGLSISKQIVEQHNGMIWVESKPGQGSTFYVRLPKPPGGKANPLKTQQTNALTT